MSDIYITLAGLNHKTAAVDIREKYAFSAGLSQTAYEHLKDERIQEALILSTCNRVEILGVGVLPLSDILLERWAQACGSSLDEIRPHVYVHENLDAVKHVFEVASSLDSMVIGEPQILGQLKKAYREAVDSHHVGSVLNHLLHHAFSVAKRVRTETAVASSAVSISYAAVELAKRIFGELPGHKAMLLGAGEMSELAALHLLQNGIDELIVANRTLAHGMELAKKFHGRPIPFEELPAHLHEVDIIISSTGSREPVLGKKEVAMALERRRNQPVFLIDIAVPRDIEADVNSLDNVYLYDIDDLKDIVEENMAVRKEEADRGRLIIAEELAKFKIWRENLRIKPTIQDLVNRGEEIAEHEIARTLKYLGPVNPGMEKALRTMAMAIVKKMNHDPITFLKNPGMSQDDPLARIHLARRIFHLDANDHLTKP